MLALTPKFYTLLPTPPACLGPAVRSRQGIISPALRAVPEELGEVLPVGERGGRVGVQGLWPPIAQKQTETGKKHQTLIAQVPG